jgi:hypothetical protein
MRKWKNIIAVWGQASFQIVSSCPGSRWNGPMGKRREILGMQGFRSRYSVLPLAKLNLPLGF